MSLVQEDACGEVRRLERIVRSRAQGKYDQPSILLVKTSSLGDIVANFPVVADILRWRPDAGIDWVVEESYAQLLRLHPGVRDAIVVAQRRWRKGPLSVEIRAERRAFVQRLRSRRYDFVIDTQGLLKSAVITWHARGLRVGQDWSSAREPLATLAYHRRFAVPRNLHAVERNRRLAASALGYGVEADADFGLAPVPMRRLAVPRGFWVALHGSSRDQKLWPETRWIELAHALAPRTVVLPWGSERERVRSERLKAAIPAALVPPRMQLPEIAALLRAARFVVGLDTGLTHLAAALGAPVVALFSGSDPALSGVRGGASYFNLGALGRAPDAAEVATAIDALALRRDANASMRAEYAL